MEFTHSSKREYREQSGIKSSEKSAREMSRKELEENYIKYRTESLEFSRAFLSMVRRFPRDNELWDFVKIDIERLKIAVDFDTYMFIKA